MVVGYVVAKVVESFDFGFKFDGEDGVGDERFVFPDPLLYDFCWFCEENCEGRFEHKMFVRR